MKLLIIALALLGMVGCDFVSNTNKMCPVCRITTSRDIKYCWWDGVKLETMEEVLTCSVCKTELSYQDKFCENCGQVTKWSR
ncbi:MAG: zinc ribbon domain-containing protein [Janthinobacterium sp.]|jgi:hypothetical protein